MSQILNISDKLECIYIPKIFETIDLSASFVEEYNNKVGLSSNNQINLTNFLNELDLYIGLNNINFLSLFGNDWNIGSGTNANAIIGNDSTLVNGPTWGNDGIVLSGSGNQHILVNHALTTPFTLIIYANYASQENGSSQLDGRIIATSRLAGSAGIQLDVRDVTLRYTARTFPSGALEFSSPTLTVGNTYWLGGGYNGSQVFTVLNENIGSANGSYSQNGNTFEIGGTQDSGFASWHGYISFAILINKQITTNENSNIRTSFINNIING